MDRVAFLIEETNDRFSALLNPETVRVRRRAGVRALVDRPGVIGGTGSSDDTLISTAGGRTEVELDLVFDVDMVRTDPRPTDVRDLTGPIWRLSENDRTGRIIAFRLIWGKWWNLPLVIESISERFDRFDRNGNPLRSWLSIRALRTAEAEEPPRGATSDLMQSFETTPRAPSGGGTGAETHMVVGGDGGGGVRVDDLADELGDGPQDWRYLADSNPLDFLPWVAAGTLITVNPGMRQ